MRLLGVILAGGRSSRFGSDKAMARLDGRTLLDHAAAALGAHVAAVAVCGRTEPRYLCLADRPAPDLGPLGGLNAALHHAAAHRYDAVLATGCDMPCFPAALANALIVDGPAVLQGQPLAGFWPAALACALDDHLATAADRSLRAWMRRTAAREVAAEVVLPNINTPADLAMLGGGSALSQQS